MNTCETCRHWKPINTDGLKEYQWDNALTHAARESLESGLARGLCLKIPVSASRSDSDEIDFTVDSYQGFEQDGYEVIADKPKAYVSQFYDDPHDLSTSFVSGKDFGCILHDPKP